jgi:hypothetical protein
LIFRYISTHVWTPWTSTVNWRTVGYRAPIRCVGGSGRAGGKKGIYAESWEETATHEWNGSVINKTVNKNWVVFDNETRGRVCSSLFLRDIPNLRGYSSGYRIISALSTDKVE